MEQKNKYLKYLPTAIGVGLVVVIAIVLYLVRDIFEKPIQSKKQVQQISVVQPPPPPPPPPEQKPPEPEVKEEKIEEPEPEPEPEPEQPEAEAPPPGEELGVDAAGGAGSDAFGLMGKKGGRGLIGGGGGNAIIWYGQHIGKELTDELHRSLKDKARNSSYSAVVHLWIGPDGGVSRVELANSSGTAEIDQALKAALNGIRAGRFKPPPEHMPQPLKVRIRS
ncbi:outer membrane transport energization protein TonB [Methylomagnum ishizawai]|uniref:Outer membrane transport energization protein TonB n=1 Tax=Methylomagnum ishizawai TaxID=1760988 RepID=A0A1Y6D408_9GAMM|nr:energy transducer TonB [Methylomagnum ishizawai]SMF97346.1 outer membrane transport energization protein TonB [Methylomagnum ishizawai]